MHENGVVRLAAMGDIHCTKTSSGSLQPVFAQARASADVLLLCGDLTDYGLPDEAHILAKELRAAMDIPVVAVLGNHDFESGKHDEVRDILSNAGVKGFIGGFGDRALGPWGESIIGFVRTAA